MQATWHLPNGETRTATVPQGETLMEAARALGIAEIRGDCGGNLSCATCHVIIDPAWLAAVGVAQGFEDDMLDATESPRTQASRLSCQLKMSATLDGIHLHIPD